MVKRVHNRVTEPRKQCARGIGFEPTHQPVEDPDAQRLRSAVPKGSGRRRGVGMGSAFQLSTDPTQPLGIFTHGTVRSSSWWTPLISGGTGTLLQTPSRHESTVDAPRLSSHVSPLFRFVSAQLEPNGETCSASQLDTTHCEDGTHCTPARGFVPRQTPAEQMSFTVSANPSSQGVLSAAWRLPRKGAPRADAPK